MTAADLIQRAERRSRLPDPKTRRYLRERCGLTQTEIAIEFGVSPATVSRWEDGKRMPRGEKRDRYCELLDALERAIANGELGRHAA